MARRRSVRKPRSKRKSHAASEEQVNSASSCGGPSSASASTSGSSSTTTLSAQSKLPADCTTGRKRQQRIVRCRKLAKPDKGKGDNYKERKRTVTTSLDASLRLFDRDDPVRDKRISDAVAMVLKEQSEGLGHLT